MAIQKQADGTYVNVVGNYVQSGTMQNGKFVATNPGKSTQIETTPTQRAPMTRNIINAQGQREQVYSAQSNLPTGARPTTSPVLYGQTPVQPDLSNRYQQPQYNVETLKNGTTWAFENRSTRSGIQKQAELQAAGLMQDRLTTLYSGDAQINTLESQMAELRAQIKKRGGTPYPQDLNYLNGLQSQIDKRKQALAGSAEGIAATQAAEAEAFAQARPEMISAARSQQSGETAYTPEAFKTAVGIDSGAITLQSGLDDLERQKNQAEEEYARSEAILNRQKQAEIDRLVANRMASVDVSSIETRNQIEAQIRAQITAKYDDPDNPYNLRLDQLAFDRERLQEGYDKSVQDYRQSYFEASKLGPEEQQKNIDEAQFSAWANGELAKDPTLTNAYLKNKWNAINKYEEKDPNAKANVVTWETMLSRGEVDTSNQVATFQSAIDLTGDAEKAFELLKTTGNTEVANEFRSAWTEKRYGIGAVTRDQAVQTTTALFSGEESSPDAVIKFVEDSEGVFPESFIARQLQNIANSDAADPRVKAMAQDYLSSEFQVATSVSGGQLSNMISTLKERPDLYDGLPASTKKELLNAGFVPESQGGASLSFDQKINIPAIGRMLYGARISDKETERVQDIVTSPEAQGLDRFGLIQRIMGFNLKKNEDLGESLMNQIIAIAPEEGLAGFDMLGLSRLLNEDKTDQAIRKVETFSNSLAKKNEGERFISESFVSANVEKYNGVMEEMNKLSQELGFGPVEGSIAQSLGRFKPTERKQIAGAMAASIAKMRNELLGSAVTEAESAFLQDMLPNETDRIEDAAVKLDRLKENAIIELNAMRSVYGMPTLGEQELLNKELKERLYTESGGVFTEKDLQSIGIPADEVRSLDTDTQRVLGRKINQSPDKLKSDYDEIKRYGGTIQDLIDYYNQDVLPEVEKEIKSGEGFREQAYLDTSGIPTVGYGFTKINGVPVQMGDTITQEEADAEIKRQIAAHSNYKDLIQVDLAPNQEAALASFEYNLGPNIWKTTGADIIAAINSGDLQGAARIMRLHNKGRDPETKQLSEVKGLTNRRNREAELLMNA